MNKLGIQIAALCAVVIGGVLHAHEFRSPLRLERDVWHYSLGPVENTWWFDLVKADDCRRKDRCWDFNVKTWSGMYFRCADRAFFDTDIDCDGLPKNRSTRKTTSLSQLWFGTTEFVGGDVFPTGEIINPIVLSEHPVLGFARVTPDFTYSEKGVYWGVHICKEFGKDNRWHVGKRISLPFKVIEVRQRCGFDIQAEGLDDVFVNRALSTDEDSDPTQTEYAYRLDFLSTLVRTFQNSLGQEVSVPFLKYGNGSNDMNETSIGDQRISFANENVTFELPPVYAIRRSDGSVPSAPFRKLASQVTGSVNADGSGGVDNDVLFFRSGTNYLAGLGVDTDAQADLWIVPRQTDAINNNTPDQIVNRAENIGRAVRAIVDANEGLFSENIIDFFRKECGIDLCANERTVGLGDLNTETYVGYTADRWFADFVVGVVWPTGKKRSEAERIYFQSTGHNGHFELKFGNDLGWKPCDYFAFLVDWSFNHVFERTEKVAAAFKGSTVTHINAGIDAKVKWNYFVLHADFNFFHPCNSELGAVFGYELFAKRKDRVRLACPDTDCQIGFAQDCLGNKGQLDLELLEKRTNSMTHKLRGEVFHRWAFFELFMGGSHIVAGRNAMQETEAHFGLAIYF